MPFFAYRGRDAQGVLKEGLLEGADSNAVADQLTRQGIVPVSIVTAEAPPGQPVKQGGFFAEKVRVEDIMLFSRQMYTLLKAGVPILRALAGLQESVQNKTFAAVLGEIRSALDSGRELSAALAEHPKMFTPFYISMVRVGEMTGLLETIFLRLADHLEFEKEMRQRVAAAVRYPMFVLAVMAVAIVVINIFVIPAFAGVFAAFKAELPLMTRILIGSSKFFVHFWPLLLVAVVGSVVAFRRYTATAAGRLQWDQLKLRLPIAGDIITKATLARFARSFALASQSGVPMVQGLVVVSRVVDNEYIASRILQMRDGMERGESILRMAIASGVFTPVVLQMIAVGEETGELDSLMQEIADMYEREVDYAIRTLSARIEPIMLVGLGGLVLVLALGVFLPIWDLGKAAIH